MFTAATSMPATPIRPPAARTPAPGGLRARLEWADAARSGGLSFNPYGEVSYLHTHMDGYTEHGGGFPATYQAVEDDATDLLLGVNSTYALSSRTEVFGLLEGVHRFNESAAPISGKVIGLFPFELAGQDYNRNWLRAGVGVAAHVGPGTASLSINATTEGEAPDTWLAGTYQVAFRAPRRLCPSDGAESLEPSFFGPLDPMDKTVPRTPYPVRDAQPWPGRLPTRRGFARAGTA